VYDAETSLAINIAKITLYDTLNPGHLSIYTDSAGYFETWALGDPTITIYCRKSGYFTGDTTIQLNHDIKNLVFRLTKN